MSIELSDIYDPEAPCRLEELDHYTLIVEDAEAVSHFHQKVLGFELAEVRPLNAGTAREGAFDMLNYIMRFPDDSGRTIVITEGLTDESIFRRHLKEHGPGIHHVAYRVDDIEDTLGRLRRAGAKLLSPEPVVEPRTGLRQIFVELPGAGYTLELIERERASVSGEFDDDNMIGLAASIESELALDEGTTESTNQSTRIERWFASRPDAVSAMLADPSRLGEWTGHRTVRQIGSEWREVRWFEDASIFCERGADWVSYTWRVGEASRTFEFRFRAHDSGCLVWMELAPELSAQQRQRLKEILSAELLLLACCLGETLDSEDAERALMLVDAHAKAIMERRGL